MKLHRGECAGHGNPAAPPAGKQFVCSGVMLLVAAFSAGAQSDSIAWQDPSRLAEQIVPLASQFALGAVAGFVVGLLLRKVGKFIAIGVAVAFVAIQLLAFYEVIDLGPLTALFGRAVTRVEGELPSLWALVSANVPAAIGALVGLVVGLCRGKGGRKEGDRKK